MPTESDPFSQPASANTKLETESSKSEGVLISGVWTGVLKRPVELYVYKMTTKF
ncbi:hypothetical protein [Thalassobacillus sp. CUG 92003]|uniref:hypothetical protein n=1 Tax=Thalassobacillus sp. CUG 92003 TaxID=2736641 RepID=UPI0015E6E8EA|nr:hypothetical protein [Thalassobacillus sp. CUG 92003]